jgi:hypothetical protein
MDQQPGDLEIVALLRQLFDRVAPVAQDALFPVDEGDRALAPAGIGVSGVERNQPGLAAQARDVERGFVLAAGYDRQIDGTLAVGDLEGSVPLLRYGLTGHCTNSFLSRPSRSPGPPVG